MEQNAGRTLVRQNPAGDSACLGYPVRWLLECAHASALRIWNTDWPTVRVHDASSTSVFHIVHHAHTRRAAHDASRDLDTLQNRAFLAGPVHLDHGAKASVQEGREKKESWATIALHQRGVTATCDHVPHVETQLLLFLLAPFYNSTYLVRSQCLLQTTG